MEGKTILLVEDDFLNRRLSKKCLIENGYSICEAKSVSEALEIIKKHKIDLAILDINLGENKQNGISLGAHIKEFHTFPFIYLTAYENPQIITEAVSTLPHSYLTKPFKLVDLITSVEIAIRQTANSPQSKPTIRVKDGEYNIELPLEEIYLVESIGNYLHFHTEKKEYKTRSTIKQAMETLPKNTFLQTHRAYVVNRNKIDKFSIKSLIIKDMEVPVSKSFSGNILSILNKTYLNR